eukprot:3728219-Prymnesium_polylepis.2
MNAAAHVRDVVRARQVDTRRWTRRVRRDQICRLGLRRAVAHVPICTPTWRWRARVTGTE